MPERTASRFRDRKSGGRGCEGAESERLCTNQLERTERKTTLRNYNSQRTERETTLRNYNSQRTERETTLRNYNSQLELHLSIDRFMIRKL